MTIILAGISIVLLVAVIVMYRKTVVTINRIDAMLDAAINDTFQENGFSEEKLSRLESRMYQYLSQGNTARKQINSEKDAIKQLVSDISHQTKTPIANILLYTQLLNEKNLDKETKEFVTQIEGQTEKLNFLIQSLIKTSRLENGIITVHPKENSVNQLLETIEKSFQGQTEGRILTVNAGQGFKACFDFKWTLEAVSNIVDNAIKYTFDSGNITISAKEYEFFIRVDIQDNGIGISEEETAKIFSRFYRSPQVNDQKGVGIGLYLAREIISRQGGYIKVFSEVGRGSLFSVFLPKELSVN